MWSWPGKPQDPKMLLCDVHVPYVFDNALETNKNAKKKEKLKLKKIEKQRSFFIPAKFQSMKR